MEVHIRQLHGAGATTLIVPNLPPLEMTPEILSRSNSQQAAIRDEVIDYNSKLATLIVDLRAELGRDRFFPSSRTWYPGRNDFMR